MGFNEAIIYYCITGYFSCLLLICFFSSRLALTLLIVVFASFSYAQDAREAQQLVQKTTDRVTTVIKGARQYVDEDPERFYKEIEIILNDVIDFNSFARGVMGDYGSKKGYMALASKEEKTQFKARITRFSSIFKNGLVQTYAKGLLAFSGNTIDVLPLAEEDLKKNDGDSYSANPWWS